MGTDGKMGTIIWGKYFIGAQGYMVEHNMLYQEKSIFLLDNNGCMYSSKQTKHI